MYVYPGLQGDNNQYDERIFGWGAKDINQVEWKTSLQRTIMRIQPNSTWVMAGDSITACRRDPNDPAGLGQGNAACSACHCLLCERSARNAWTSRVALKDITLAGLSFSHGLSHSGAQNALPGTNPGCLTRWLIT